MRELAFTNAEAVAAAKTVASELKASAALAAATAAAFGARHGGRKRAVPESRGVENNVP